MSFIVKQPNGLYCRFSTVLDCPSHWNMTKEEYIEYCAQQARDEARETIENRLQPFEFVKEYFVPNNMSKSEFKKFLQDVSK